MQNRRNPIYLIIIGSLLAGLFTGRVLFFNIAYLFGSLIIISLLWSWFAVRGIAVGRSTRTRRSQVGRSFAETFSVRNSGFLPKLWLEVRDHSTLPTYRASHVVPTIMPRRTYEWRAETSCVVRGEFQLGPLTVISGDPFGLFLTPRRVNAIERIIVYPATVPINNFVLPIGLLSGGEAQRHLTQHVTTNAAGVREYVPGDSINRIHWKSTARRNKLIVKEFELDPLVDVWLFVDFSTQSLVEDPSVQRFGQVGAVIPSSQMIPASTEEYAVIIAASLASYFIEIERALGFAAHIPHREIWQPERGNRQLTRIMEALAVARSQSNRTMRDMLSLETPSLSRGTTLVIVTSSLDRSWIAETQSLARKGIRPMCVFVDPTSFGHPQSSEEVRGMLQLAKIPTVVVRKGDDIAAALVQRPS